MTFEGTLWIFSDVVYKQFPINLKKFSGNIKLKLSIFFFITMLVINIDYSWLIVSLFVYGTEENEKAEN